MNYLTFWVIDRWFWFQVLTSIWFHRTRKISFSTPASRQCICNNHTWITQCHKNTILCIIIFRIYWTMLFFIISCFISPSVITTLQYKEFIFNLYWTIESNITLFSSPQHLKFVLKFVKHEKIYETILCAYRKRKRTSMIIHIRFYWKCSYTIFLANI